LAIGVDVFDLGAVCWKRCDIRIWRWV